MGGVRSYIRNTNVPLTAGVLVTVDVVHFLLFGRGPFEVTVMLSSFLPLVLPLE